MSYDGHEGFVLNSIAVLASCDHALEKMNHVSVAEEVC